MKVPITIEIEMEVVDTTISGNGWEGLPAEAIKDKILKVFDVHNMLSDRIGHRAEHHTIGFTIKSVR